jgi:hypothetical protein
LHRFTFGLEHSYRPGRVGREPRRRKKTRRCGAAIIEKLEEFEQNAESLDVGTDSFDDVDDDAYDPTEFIDEDDEV